MTSLKLSDVRFFSLQIKACFKDNLKLKILRFQVKKIIKTLRSLFLSLEQDLLYQNLSNSNSRSLLQAVRKPAANLQKLAYTRLAFYKPAASCFLEENFRLYCILTFDFTPVPQTCLCTVP